MPDNDTFDFELPDVEEMAANDQRFSNLDFHDRPFLSTFRAWCKGTGPAVSDPDMPWTEEGFPADPFLSMTGSFRLRDSYIAEFGFCVPTGALINRLAELGPILEIGAGHGTLSRLIGLAGGEAIATDLHPHFMAPSRERAWSDVLALDAEEAVADNPGRVILSSWPSREDPWLTRAAKRLAPGQILVMIGEGRGGCTGTPCFYDLLGDVLQPAQELSKGADVWCFPGIHDRVHIYRRR